MNRFILFLLCSLTAFGQINISSKVSKAGDTMTGSLSLASAVSLNWNSDTFFRREAAGTASLRNLTSQQTWLVYGTTDSGVLNYRRLRSTMTTAGAATIAAEGLGTGVTGNTLILSVDGSTRATISSSLFQTTGNFGIEATAGAIWTGRARLQAPADAQFLISNSGITDVDIFLKLGVNTSASAGIKRVGTTIQTRLNDDSAFAATQSLYQRFGAGSPEGVVTAPVGCRYSRTDGGANTSFYVKESGAGNTGWVAK